MNPFQIKPFPRVAVYPTSWAGELTFEQIHDDLTHYAANVLKSYGAPFHELEDCLQNGFMALWETLTQQRDFLTEKTRRQAVFFILARSKISTMQYQAQMYDSFEAMISDHWHNTADEQIDGMQHRRGERWAGFATEIDMQVDIERIMGRLAHKYADSLRHLTALYFITTQVSRKDAASIAGMTPWNWYNSFVLPVLAEVRYEFAQVFMEQHDYPTPQPIVERADQSRCTGRFVSPYIAWRDKYRAGHTAPADDAAGAVPPHAVPESGAESAAQRQGLPRRRSRCRSQRQHFQEAHEARRTAASRGICRLTSVASWLETLNPASSLPFRTDVLQIY